MSDDDGDDNDDRPRPAGTATFSGVAGRPTIYYSLWIAADPRQRQSVRRQLREQPARRRSAKDDSSDKTVEWYYEIDLKGKIE